MDKLVAAIIALFSSLRSFSMALSAASVSLLRALPRLASLERFSVRQQSGFDGGSDELVAALSSCTGLTALQFEQIANTAVFEPILTSPRVSATLTQLSFVILRAVPEGGEQDATDSESTATTVNWRAIFPALRSLTSLSLTRCAGGERILQTLLKQPKSHPPSSLQRLTLRPKLLKPGAASHTVSSSLLEALLRPRRLPCLSNVLLQLPPDTLVRATPPPLFAGPGWPGANPFAMFGGQQRQQQSASVLQPPPTLMAPTFTFGAQHTETAACPSSSADASLEVAAAPSSFPAPSTPELRRSLLLCPATSEAEFIPPLRAAPQSTAVSSFTSAAVTSSSTHQSISSSATASLRAVTTAMTNLSCSASSSSTAASNSLPHLHSHAQVVPVDGGGGSSAVAEEARGSSHWSRVFTEYRALQDKYPARVHLRVEAHSRTSASGW
jgi:hypothetical protein